MRSTHSSVFCSFIKIRHVKHIPGPPKTVVEHRGDTPDKTEIICFKISMWHNKYCSISKSLKYYF